MVSSFPSSSSLRLSRIEISADSLDSSQPGELNFQRIGPNLPKESSPCMPSSGDSLFQYVISSLSLFFVLIYPLRRRGMRLSCGKRSIVRRWKMYLS